MTTVTTTHGIRRVGPRIGAEVIGLDLTKPVDGATADQLRQAFREHKVLVFRNQHLTPDQHVEAVRVFAEPFDHPTAVKDATNPLVYPYNVRQTGKASVWHIGGLWRSPVFAIPDLAWVSPASAGEGNAS
ncbi:TauD/TfdA dioxygenase family protein [Streptomyces microflavus]|uniref:TauD/TfdA dioxygenase family protein n=1 Tax=Streptomyces microflavus TaxID=1919 RepID=UPI0037F1A10E